MLKGCDDGMMMRNKKRKLGSGQKSRKRDKSIESWMLYKECFSKQR